METTLHVNDYKFHKLGKWRNNKNWWENWFKQNLRKIYSSWILFCCFTFKCKLINLFLFLWKILFNQTIKTTKQVSWRFFNENCTVHSLLFLKNTNLCLLLPQRNWISQNLSGYICRQQKISSTQYTKWIKAPL